ncbi:Mitochondrial sodium/calcium exchanger protein [Bagarius yarrelli]|uniref:Mitochondrial sodium/calcium exchanger protein n=1 Tax=Bagarius yarrelli TaxID=175774 RepID=A0A556V7F1_BAGYA|nr:Mitochondrial sodium/calcium exchanger protein [Bagarius yarrelli]
MLTRIAWYVDTAFLNSSCVFLALALLKSEYVLSENWTVLPENSTTLETDSQNVSKFTATSSKLKSKELECDKVMTIPANLRCEFVLNSTDCQVEGGFINHLYITFCLFPTKLLPLAIFFYGVTFLALGNGAPDVFSAMAAFSRPQTAGLAIGSLFGAGIFVTTVVAGSVAFVKPFTVASRPFLRDVIFYMAAVFWTFNILYKREISLKEALGYLGLYLLYVITVVVSAYIYNRQARSHYKPPPFAADFSQEESEPLISHTESTSCIFLRAISPIDSSSWRTLHWCWKVLKIIQLPFEVVLLLTVPVVDPDKIKRNWTRSLNCLHLITGPLVCVLTFNLGTYGLYLIEGEFPVWVLTAFVGAFLSGIVYCSTTNDHPPVYHSFFALLGFIVSALWISTVASEVLETEGLLCWVLAAGLGLSLVFSFVLVPLQSFHLSRPYGIFLLLFYAAFLIIALLTEFGKIHM